MGRFKIGILENVLNADWDDVFPLAKALGYDGIELGIRGENYRDTELWMEGGLDALAHRSEESGIPIFSICLHTFWTYTFADPNVANRCTAKQIAFHVINACKTLGVRTILIPVTNPLELSLEEAAHRWTYETRAIAADAAKHEVHIGLENVGRSHIVTGEQVLEMIEAVDNPFVGAYFDIGNAKMLGSDPVADIHTLKDRIVQVHIKDPRKDRTPCYLGDGDIDLEGCLKALTEVGYRGPLIFETPALNDPTATAKRNLMALSALTEAVGAT
jgi:hexulose-6-phosphate isomerase